MKIIVTDPQHDRFQEIGEARHCYLHLFKVTFADGDQYLVSYFDLLEMKGK